MVETVSTIEELTKQKDQAYWERNQLVAALSHIYPAWLGKHTKSLTTTTSVGDVEEWDDDWRTIVYIELPSLDEFGNKRQLSWHIHDTELPMFDHLKYDHTRYWDYHSTEEKYRRLRQHFTGVKAPETM